MFYFANSLVTTGLNLVTTGLNLKKIILHLRSFTATRAGFCLSSNPFPFLWLVEVQVRVMTARSEVSPETQLGALTIPHIHYE